MPKAKPATNSARRPARAPGSTADNPGDVATPLDAAGPVEAAKPVKAAGPVDQEQAAAADLSYNEAHAALQLTLAALQANDLDVEAMTGLYRRARAYLERCEAVLTSVEQEVLLWDESSELPRPMTDSL